MNLTTTADSVMMFCILASMAIFDAFSTLLSTLKKGIFVDQRSLLMKKTNRELKEMLVGVEKISKLNKKQLVDLILVNQQEGGTLKLPLQRGSEKLEHSFLLFWIC